MRTPSGYLDVSFTLPRLQAREKARQYLERYSVYGYETHVADWQVREDDRIYFVIRRLRSGD